jgi:hypothetical protein
MRISDCGLSVITSTAYRNLFQKSEIRIPQLPESLFPPWIASLVFFIVKRIIE